MNSRPADRAGKDSRSRLAPGLPRQSGQLPHPNSLAAAPGVVHEELQGATGVWVVRYLLHGPVLPPVTQVLTVGETARKAAMSRYGKLYPGQRSRVLSGKDSHGTPLQGHVHAFYLPSDEDGDGRLDHLTVWVRGGLNSYREVEALASIRELRWAEKESSGVGLVLLGTGDDRLASKMAPSLFGPSRRWVSFSPFVLVRHTKARKVNTPEGQRVLVVDGPAEQLRRELENHGHPHEDVHIEEYTPLRGRWTLFHRWRKSGPRSAGGTFGFALSFRSEVSGPIALGYACHYGLGLFLAEPRE